MYEFTFRAISNFGNSTSLPNSVYTNVEREHVSIESDVSRLIENNIPEIDKNYESQNHAHIIYAQE
jgi:hypothetical protein